jgi:adenylate cyclase
LAAEQVERRLAAVLAADVAGYSRLMGVDEEGTLARLKAVRKALVDPAIAKHRGRIVKTTGDGMLVEFASAVDAVRGAVEIQRGMVEQNAEIQQDVRIEFRIGIHVGDIIIDDNDIFGDGVNIAARLEGIAVPGGVCISDDTYRQIRDRVDAAFEDKGEAALKNIARPVRVFTLTGAKQPAPKVIGSAAPLTLPDKPSIAVLPFQNMSGDPEQEYFADGMVDDIITALSRFKSLFVIARNSSFIYKGKAVDIKQVGRELGVRYVLEGSVRKAAGRVRITGQLIDATTGTHLWADKIDGSVEDVFALQDQVTTSVVGAVAPQIERAEIERAYRKPPESLDAYDCFLKGLACLQQTDRNNNAEALKFFNRAIELDTQMACAYGRAAVCFSSRKLHGWFDDIESDLRETRRLIESAVKFGQHDAGALSDAARVYGYVFLEHETAASLVDRALHLNANLAYAWRTRGSVSAWLGQHDKALMQFDHAIRLNPVDPQNVLIEVFKTFIFVFLGNYEEACHWGTQALIRQPKLGSALRSSCAAYALAGRIEEARDLVRRLNEVDEKLLLNRREYIPWRREQDIARLLEGYRLAGMPEWT